MAISYFDAPAGSGKTHVLVAHAHQMAQRGRKVLVVQPSRELISRTIAETLQPLKPTYRHRVIHADTHAGHVVAGIVAHFRDTSRNQGEILFITHAAFLLLPFLERAGDWMVIVDEVLQVDLFESFNIPDTHTIITDALALRPGEGAYGRLLPSPSSSSFSLDQIGRNVGNDQVFAQFSGLARRVLSDQWEVYTHQDSYGRLVTGRKGGQLQTYSLLTADIFLRFAETIIASACFRDSMLYRLWSTAGVRMMPVAQSFFDGLRYRGHSNGELIAVKYVLDEHWSKTKRDLTLDSGNTLGDTIIAKIGELFGTERFIWLGNKDRVGAFDHFPNATQLPNSPHGRNDFQQFHNVVVLSALNPPPTHFAFMGTRGVCGEALKTAHYRSAVYQAVMRSSIRNPNDDAPKTIVVMDRPTAHWLAECFPGARVEQLSTQASITSRPRGRPCIGAVPLSSSERVRRCRQGKRATSQTSAVVQYGSVFATKFAVNSSLQLELDRADDDGFIALLGELHQRVVRAKEDNFLISPATFDRTVVGAGTKRGLANVTRARGIWLDFDDGDLAPADFASVFSRLRFAAFNTHSSTDANNRWRAFIPTSRAMSADEYGQIARTIHRRLVDHRWHDRKHEGRRHGLDTGKLHAAALFFAPCQASKVSSSFFEDHNRSPRSELQVDQWLPDTLPVSVGVTSTSPPMESELDTRAIDDAIGAWRRAPAGLGHREFYVLAKKLGRAGIGIPELESLLTQEARHARSPTERLAEIPRLIAEQKTWSAVYKATPAPDGF